MEWYNEKKIRPENIKDLVEIHDVEIDGGDNDT